MNGPYTIQQAFSTLIQALGTGSSIHVPVDLAEECEKLGLIKPSDKRNKQ